MNLSSQWLGRATSPTSLNLGDLFLLNHGSTAYLAMKVEGVENGKPREFVMLLRTFGDPSSDSDPFPRVIYTTSLSTGDDAVRLIEGGEIIAQPLGDTADKALAPPKGGTPNGALAIFVDGTLGIFVKVDLMPQWFSLASGKAVPPLSRVRVDPWRLVWRFGNETMELLRLPAAD